MSVRTICAGVAALTLLTPVFAQDDTPPPAVTAALSDGTRTIVIKEMQAIAGAMGRIHTAMVTGDHATVQQEAGRIHDSFVLKQALSDARRREIGTKLPPDFVAADQSFHELAARLTEAGKQQDPRLERLWFQEMTRACQACHADYAQGRFPGLTEETQGGHHH